MRRCASGTPPRARAPRGRRRRVTETTGAGSSAARSTTRARPTARRRRRRRLARLRRADRGRRPAQGRDGARPRVRRRRGRPDLGAPRRPGRARDRARHDRRDARPRARQRGRGGRENVEFLKGYIEEMPLETPRVDVVISNCVINLSGDKPRVLARGRARAGPGGRFAVSDVIADRGHGRGDRADMAQWTGCIAGALTEAEFRGALAAAGFDDVEIRRDASRARARGRRRSSARASREHHRDPAQRPPDPLPPLGGLAVVAVRDRPRRPTGSSGAAMGERRPRRSSSSCSSSLMVAEERITTKFSGLVGAHGSEEEATFLATQQVDEARHMQFYARFQDEVSPSRRRSPRTSSARAQQVSPRLRADLRRRARRGARARSSRRPGDLARQGPAS